MAKPPEIRRCQVDAYEYTRKSHRHRNITINPPTIKRIHGPKYSMATPMKKYQVDSDSIMWWEYPTVDGWVSWPVSNLHRYRSFKSCCLDNRLDLRRLYKCQDLMNSSDNSTRRAVLEVKWLRSFSFGPVDKAWLSIRQTSRQAGIYML